MPPPAETFLKTALRACGVTLLLVTMIAVWAWRLHPGPPAADPSMAERVRTLSTLTSYVAQAPESMRLPAITALAWLPDDTLQAILEWRYEPVERQVRLLTVQSGPVEQGPLHAGLLFTALGTSNWASLEGTELMISAAGERLPDSLKIEALRLLSTKALTVGQAEPAMEILQRAIRIAPDNWDLLLEAVTTCRQASRSDLALKLLTERMNDATNPLADAHQQEALDLEISLMIRSGRVREALALCEERFKLGRNDAHDIERIATTASFAGLPGQALPALDHFLSKQPLHKLNPVELTDQSTVPSDYHRALELHARLADEAGDARRSRDSLLRLAALGDMRFAGRLSDLCQQAPNTNEWESIKTKLPEPMVAAKDAIKAGHSAIAEELLHQVLKLEPDNREAAFLLTHTESDHARNPQSRARLWETFCRSHPSDAEGLRQLADAHEAAGQHALALRTLKALPDGDQTPQSLTSLHRLALKQGDMTIALESQKALLEHKRDASPADYLHLSQLQHSGNQNATSNAALIAGLDRFPDNALLREILNRDSNPEIRPAKAVFAAEAE